VGGNAHFAMVSRGLSPPSLFPTTNKPPPTTNKTTTQPQPNHNHVIAWQMCCDLAMQDKKFPLAVQILVCALALVDPLWLFLMLDLAQKR